MMENKFPVRKHPRLKDYDYGSEGYCFVTMCVDEMRQILGKVEVGRDAFVPPSVRLSRAGLVTQKYIENIKSSYENVKVDKYVIMPNHVHMIIIIEPLPKSGGMRASRPTLFTVVRSTKAMITRELGRSIWQESYYESIIRSDEAYRAAWQYIDDNPGKWAEDKYYFRGILE